MVKRIFSVEPVPIMSFFSSLFLFPFQHLHAQVQRASTEYGDRIFYMLTKLSEQAERTQNDGRNSIEMMKNGERKIGFLFR